MQKVFSPKYQQYIAYLSIKQELCEFAGVELMVYISTT